MLRVQEVMTTKVVTTHPDTVRAEAAPVPAGAVKSLHFQSPRLRYPGVTPTSGQRARKWADGGSNSEPAD